VNAPATSSRAPVAHERVLGIDFVNGTAADAAAFATVNGGCVAIPAAPALLKLKHDEDYRRALQRCDLVLPDSGLLALVWRLVSGRTLRKISGIEYLSALLNERSLRERGKTFCIVGSSDAKAAALKLLLKEGFEVDEEDFFVAPHEIATTGDHALLLAIEERRPTHIIIALRSGVQETLGIYLRDFLMYRPAIHCVGAALGFRSGYESQIPEVLERRHLGWLARLHAEPRMILPRLGIALSVAIMILRSRSELPPLQTRWSDR
jgi:UDP-N-acetyl-D-mannosaminuronic acid transferase (WecB/TagA/CpsF family)